MQTLTLARAVARWCVVGRCRAFHNPPFGPVVHERHRCMSMDVVDLRNFYGQSLGAVARRFIGRGIRRRWQDLHGMRTLGIGYPTPYLGLFREEAERCF